MEKRKCKFEKCGKLFTPKRSDQQYCNSECKVKKNNEDAKLYRHIAKEDLLAMKKNYIILMILLRDEVFEITSDELADLGFDFRYPGFVVNSENEGFYRLHDIRLQPIMDDKFEISYYEN